MKESRDGYRLGDKYSDDFDYYGMLQMGARAKLSMGAKKLLKLFRSFEDVNYHTESAPLWDALEALKSGDEDKAAKLLKEFNKRCQASLRTHFVEEELLTERRQMLLPKALRSPGGRYSEEAIEVGDHSFRLTADVIVHDIVQLV